MRAMTLLIALLLSSFALAVVPSASALKCLPNEDGICVMVGPSHVGYGVCAYETQNRQEQHEVCVSEALDCPYLSIGIEGY